MTVYKRLLNLYGSGNSLRTPKEDFCTECLAGILESDQSLLNDFVTSVLGIRVDENFRVETQKVYFHEGDKSIVDMVFQSRSAICFMEMKVDSSEGANQLQKYHELLIGSTEINKRDKYLMYCTLFLEEKEHKWPEFHQLRWQDIAEFFADKTKKNTLIKTFYQFLEENKMAGNERFSYEDIVGLKRFRDITAKINEIFLRVEPDLKVFGKIRGGINATGQVKNHNRYALWCENIIGDTWSEVLISFNFSGSSFSDGPCLVTQLWISNDNSQFDKIRLEAENKSEVQFITDDANSGGALLFEKPLTDFLEKEDQIDLIKKWFSENLLMLSNFKKTTDLEWKV